MSDVPPREAERPREGEDALLLALRYLDRLTTAEEDRLFEERMAQSPDLQRAFVTLAHQQAGLKEILSAAEARSPGVSSSRRWRCEGCRH